MAKKNLQIEGQLDFFEILMADTEDTPIAMDEIMQFAECVNCWCRDCRHNEENEGEPRDFGGEKKPCPACRFCIENDEPEICEIGSYKNGCKVRAKEEGLAPDEEV